MDIDKIRSDAYKRGKASADGERQDERREGDAGASRPAKTGALRGARKRSGGEKGSGGFEIGSSPVDPSAGGDTRPAPGGSDCPRAAGGGPDAGRGPARGTENATGKVAKLLMLIGRDQAASVLSHLGEQEVVEVARRIAEVESIDAERAGEVLSEFGFEMETRPVKGGREVALSILARAFTREQAEAIVAKALGERRRHFAFLSELEPQQIRGLVKDETPAVIALILSHMEASKAAGLVAVLPEETRVAAFRRIASIGEVDSSVLERVEESLRTRVESLGRLESEQLDGRSTLAEILRRMGVDEEESLLDSLKTTDADLAADIEDRLFTIDTLLLLDDRRLSDILRSYSDHDVALVLKGKEEPIRRKVLQNLSDRRRAIVAEEYRFLGPVPKSEVSEATGRLLAQLRRMESDGTLVVRSRGETYI